MNRRQFNKLALWSASVTSLFGTARVSAATQQMNGISLRAEKAHQEFMNLQGMHMHGTEQIAMLMYPGFTAMDLVGPQYLFASLMGAQVHLVSPTDDLTPVKCDTGITITPTITQKDLPEHLDLLFIPGSAQGVLKAMQDEKFVAFIKTKAAHSKYVTSVCTGSLLLGKAGLLIGKKATSHWVTLDLLTKFGALPVQERVVWDGNIITGGGVTAGIDFGLEVVAVLRGRKYAETLQLMAEYNPRPPFDVGSPEKADPVVKKFLTEMFGSLRAGILEAIA
jgi:cyclohexyl-isocyanide hydratase